MYEDKRGLTNPIAPVPVLSLYAHEKSPIASENHDNVSPAQ